MTLFNRTDASKPWTAMSRGFKLRQVVRGVTRQVLTYGSFLAIAVVVLFPFYWMVATSLKVESEVYLPRPTLIPQVLTLSHYQRLLAGSEFMTYFLNSTGVALSTVAVVLVLSVSAGYSLGRLTYLGRQTFSRFVIVFYLFPGVLLLVPLYILISRLGLRDNPLALIIVYTTFEAPYATILLRQYFLSIPREIEDAARVDGAGRLRIIWSVIIPLARPGIAVVGINTFIAAWSEFIMASLLTVRQANKTLPVGLYEWMGTYSIDWGAMTAGAVIATLPILGLFLVMGRVFIRGLLEGATKG